MTTKKRDTACQAASLTPARRLAKTDERQTTTRTYREVHPIQLGERFCSLPASYEHTVKGGVCWSVKKHTGFTLRDGYHVRAAHERFAQAWQRAIEVGLHGILRHVEHAPDLREAQMLETVQADDRAKLRGK